MQTYNFHPYANLFPLITGPEFDELVNDVREHGVMQPILLYEGKILDGRNRYRAALEAGVPAPTEVFEGTDQEALARSLGLNLHRRHLDTSQRSAVAAELANLSLGDNRGAHRPEEGSAKLRTLIGVSQEDAAKLLNVSPRSVTAAVKLKNTAAPAILDAVKAGQIKLAAAQDLATFLPVEEQSAAIKDPQTLKTSLLKARTIKAGHERRERSAKLRAESKKVREAAEKDSGAQPQPELSQQVQLALTAIRECGVVNANERSALYAALTSLPSSK